jgi:hypothetical protein
MRISILTITVLLLLNACTKPDQENSALVKKQQGHAIPVTIIGKRNVINEIAGSAYLKRATGYFIIAGKDTSDYRVIFTENKDDGKVALDIHYDKYNKKGKLFAIRMEEFTRILPEAQKDYNFDSLATISLGRLVSTGDLAVEITKDYLKKYGENYKIIDYKVITDFLFDSELAQSFNKLFASYSIMVKQISAEKIFFTTKHDLYYSSLVDADSTGIPSRILDCITWIYLEKKPE